MMKKIISLLLVIALTATVAIGGTVAYLTMDAGDEHNVFSVGKIDVSLDEEVGIIGAGGEVKKTETGAEYTGVMPGDYLKKEVTVTNNGETDAYVAVTVTLNNAGKINAAIDEYYEKLYEEQEKSEEEVNALVQAKYDEIFDTWGLNYSKSDGNGDALGMRLTITGDDMPTHVLHVDTVKAMPDYIQYSYQNWFMSADEKAAMSNNQNYTAGLSKSYYSGEKTDEKDTTLGQYEIRYTYYAYLPAGESTTLFKGLKVPAEFNAEQLAMFDGLVIDIQASAIQADNITDPKAAFMSLATGEAIEGSPVSDAEELVSALEEGKDVYLTESIKIDPANLSNAYGTTGLNVKDGQTIDGGGNTLDISGAGGTWDSGINTTGGTIKNITVTGSFRGIFINHNSDHSEPVILENVTIDGTTYTISCDQGKNQTLSATNCTFNGWTSYAATLGSATFKNCSFGEGSDYAFCRPYAPTAFVGCEFESGYEMDPRAAVTFENCTLGGVALTADNLSTLVTSNIANATVK